MCMKVVRPSSVMLSKRSRGAPQKKNDQPHAKQITHAPEPTMWGKDATGDSLPFACDDKWSVPNARWQVAWRSERQSQCLEARTLLDRNFAGAATAERLRERRKAHDRRDLSEVEVFSTRL